MSEDEKATKAKPKKAAVGDPTVYFQLHALVVLALKLAGWRPSGKRFYSFCENAYAVRVNYLS
jgi:hypothetical protein